MLKAPQVHEDGVGARQGIDLGYSATRKGMRVRIDELCIKTAIEI